jgi:hypothetical protein
MSKAASGVMTPAQLADERARAKEKPWFSRVYSEHISFFFEPIPATLLPTIFPKDHPAWAKGNTLYEHIVDLSTLPVVFDYDVVESTKFLALFDRFSIENNWVDDNPDLLKKWMILEDQMLRKWGERGNQLSVLKTKVAENQGIIAAKYIALSKRDDFEYNRYKYAACVPHLMSYPPKGIVIPQAINRIIMGSDVRTPVKFPALKPVWM